MAYTSGRTVKSSKPTAATLRTRATKTVRILVNAYLKHEAPQATVDSTLTAGPSLETLVRTVVTFPSYVNADELATAMRALPGRVMLLRSPNDITVVRSV